MKKINKLLRAGLLGTALTAATLFAADAGAETRVTYKSAKSTSSYYQMAVQVAEAVKKSTGGAMVLTVEESQGSVQNVKESARRPGNYVFTTPRSDERRGGNGWRGRRGRRPSHTKRHKNSVADDSSGGL